MCLTPLPWMPLVCSRSVFLSTFVRSVGPLPLCPPPPLWEGEDPSNSQSSLSPSPLGEGFRERSLPGRGNQEKVLYIFRVIEPEYHTLPPACYCLVPVCNQGFAPAQIIVVVRKDIVLLPEIKEYIVFLYTEPATPG